MVHYLRGAAHLVEKPVAMAPGLIGASPELSDRDFFCFCQLVHQHAGIHLTTQKKELMRARLTKILRERGLKNFSEYYEKVVADSSGAELTCLLDAISTNQTAFWREHKHFQYLADVNMPWKVKVYTYTTPEEEQIFDNFKDARDEAEQINFMQPEGCENMALVVPCDDKGGEYGSETSKE